MLRSIDEAKLLIFKRKKRDYSRGNRSTSDTIRQ